MQAIARLLGNRRITGIVDAFGELTPSARLLPQIQNCLANRNSSTAEVIDLLRLDPALTAKTIAGANRASFGCTSHCNSLDEAVTRMGFDEVYRLVATIAARGLFKTDMAIYASAEGDFLQDSLAVAVLLPILNRSARIDIRGDELFTIGLLHSIGKMAIQAYAKLKGMEASIGQVSVEKTVALENRFFRATHPEVGAALLEKWNFSEVVVETVRFYAKADEAPHHKDAAGLLRLSVKLRSFVYDRSLESEGARMTALENEACLDDKLVPSAIERAREMFDLLLGA